MSTQIGLKRIGQRILRRLTHIPGYRSAWSKLPVGSIDTRVHYGIFPRPHYAYGTYAAADLARRLRVRAISVVEFGVAGGRSLVALECIAQEISQETGVDISVFGFDSGTGMPSPRDYRDLPYVWGEGFYKMDEARLRARLKATKLVLGDVKHTVPNFISEGGFPPLGFIAFDLDYYSSTKEALQIFDGESATRLPRVYCYFDDIMWPEYACHNEYIGELCAIREFNAENSANRALCPVHMMPYMFAHRAGWHEQIYVLHDFHHPMYATNITRRTDEDTQMRLD